MAEGGGATPFLTRIGNPVLGVPQSSLGGFPQSWVVPQSWIGVPLSWVPPSRRDIGPETAVPAKKDLGTECGEGTD